MAVLLDAVVLNTATASVLAAVIWLTAQFPWIRRRPGLRHWLWGVILLKLVTPPLFEFSILPRGWVTSERLPRLLPQAILLDERSAASLSQAEPPAASPAFVAAASAIDWRLVLVIIAGMGTAVVIVRALLQGWRLGRALRQGASNDQRLTEIANDSAKTMGVSRTPAVCVVAANVAPLLWMRWPQPLIVVPRRLVDELSDEQIACVVAHELAHLLRRDHWTNLLSLFLTALVWWNPVAWWARRELRTAQEACCDALVISRSVTSRRVYAETLFRALEFLQAERSLLPALASGFGNGSSTERRFEMIANPLVSHRLPWWSCPLLLGALAVLPCIPRITQAQEEAGRAEVIDVDYFPLWAIFERSNVAHADSDVYLLDVSRSMRQTERWTYKVHRSERGLVVLAFDRNSKKLAWSSEIELPADMGAAAGQRLLLHTGGGVVTIAMITEDKSLKIQELNGETGTVTSECQLPVHSHDRWGSTGEVLGEWCLRKNITDYDLLAREHVGEQHGIWHLILQDRSNEAPMVAGETYSSLAWRLLTAPSGPLVVELSGLKDGRITIEIGSKVWRAIHGDAPIETMHLFRVGEQDRMIIEGKAKNLNRMELRPESDRSAADKRDDLRTPNDDSTRPNDAGATLHSGNLEPYLNQAVKFLITPRPRRDAHADGVDDSWQGTQLDPAVPIKHPDERR